MHSPPRDLSVCLLAQHSFVLHELQKILSRPNFALESRPMQAAVLLRQSTSLPQASVYVLDGEAASPITIAMIAGIRAAHPEAKIVMLAEKFSEDNTFDLLYLGVKGLVTYGDIPLQLPRALQALSSGGYWVPRAVLSRFVDSLVRRRPPRLFIANDLSPREREIMEALLGNLSNKEIANKFNISERTAKFHVSNILGKFAVRRRSDLILLCAQSSSDLENKSADLASFAE